MSGRTFGVVLAGGESMRFGSDKLSVVLDGRSLLDHAVAAAAVAADEVILVVAPDAPVPQLPAAVGHRLSVARDAVAGAGPLAGVAAGLAAAAAVGGDDPRDVAIVVGGDMPRLEPAVLRLLVNGLRRDPSLLAMTLSASTGAPLPMAIRVAARQRVEDVLAAGRRSLRALLDDVPSGTVPEAAWRAIDPGGHTLLDIDTREDVDSLS